MRRHTTLLCCLALAGILYPIASPAPLVYTPGEGWTWEPVGGGGKWQRARAKEQFEVATAAFERKDYGTALKAARRVTRVWPLSDYAPEAQYLLGRCYEAKGQDEKAFAQYEKILSKYPKSEKSADVLRRQYLIANRYLAGKWFKLWGYVPIFPSMDRTAGMFEKIVAHGPYSEVAPHAQLRVGAAREKQSAYELAVAAYERAADRYHDRPAIAADALYRAGRVHEKQAGTAEYDQSTAGKAIAAYTDFLTYYPSDSRAAEARQAIEKLATEQARGNLEIARYYEKRKRWAGALVYYNEVILKDPGSTYANQSRERIDNIKQRIQAAAN